MALDDLDDSSANKLETIQDIHGWSMPRYTALKCQEASGRLVLNERKLVRDRKNKPRVQSYARILNAFLRNQIKGLTNTQAAARANVTLSTYRLLKDHTPTRGKGQNTTPYWGFSRCCFRDVVSVQEEQYWYGREPEMMRWVQGVFNGRNGQLNRLTGRYEVDIEDSEDEATFFNAEAITTGRGPPDILEPMKTTNNTPSLGGVYHG